MRLLIIFLFLATNISIVAQEVSESEQELILKQLENLRTAHLNSDVDLVDRLYHPNLILTSQSGKKYKKEVVVQNIEHKFESYQNSDFEFLKVTDDVVITNYINERKYKGFDKGKFRLSVVWTKSKGTWQIIAMQSSRINEKIANN